MDSFLLPLVNSIMTKEAVRSESRVLAQLGITNSMQISIDNIDASVTNRNRCVQQARTMPVLEHSVTLTSNNSKLIITRHILEYSMTHNSQPKYL